MMYREQSWRWKKTDGTTGTHTHRTVRGDANHPGETKAQFLARFESEIAALEIEYPPAEDQ